MRLIVTTATQTLQLDVPPTIPEVGVSITVDNTVITVDDTTITVDNE